jgi:hypothetical protein
MGREIQVILAVLRGEEPPRKKVKSSRYLTSLRKSAGATPSDLGTWLAEYSTIAGLDSMSR